MTDLIEQVNTTPEETQDRVISKRALAKGRKAVEKHNAVLHRLKVEYVPLDALFPNTYNPNRQSDHDFELLVRSMEEDGFTTPIVVNQDNIIVDGEHRWRAAQVLGMKEIPVVHVSMSAEQARISTIRHNRARGTHDVELEAEVLRDLQQLGALDWAKDSLLMDDVELNRLLNDIAAPDVMGAQDFTEAWVPETLSQDEADLIRHGGERVTEAMTVTNPGGGEATYAMTTAAVELQRKMEHAISKAKTEQDKILARRDSQVYRIALSFSGEEATIVKHVLGHRPAERLLQLCKEVNGNGRK